MKFFRSLWQRRKNRKLLGNLDQSSLRQHLEQTAILRSAFFETDNNTLTVFRLKGSDSAGWTLSEHQLETTEDLTLERLEKQFQTDGRISRASHADFAEAIKSLGQQEALSAQNSKTIDLPDHLAQLVPHYQDYLIQKGQFLSHEHDLLSAESFAVTDKDARFYLEDLHQAYIQRLQQTPDALVKKERYALALLSSLDRKNPLYNAKADSNADIFKLVEQLDQLRQEPEAINILAGTLFERNGMPPQDILQAVESAKLTTTDKQLLLSNAFAHDLLKLGTADSNAQGYDAGTALLLFGLMSPESDLSSQLNQPQFSQLMLMALMDAPDIPNKDTAADLDLHQTMLGYFERKGIYLSDALVEFAYNGVSTNVFDDLLRKGSLPFQRALFDQMKRRGNHQNFAYHMAILLNNTNIHDYKTDTISFNPGLTQKIATDPFPSLFWIDFVQENLPNSNVKMQQDLKTLYQRAIRDLDRPGFIVPIHDASDPEKVWHPLSVQELAQSFENTKQLELSPAFPTAQENVCEAFVSFANPDTQEKLVARLLIDQQASANGKHLIKQSRTQIQSAQDAKNLATVEDYTQLQEKAGILPILSKEALQQKLSPTLIDAQEAKFAPASIYAGNSPHKHKFTPVDSAHFDSLIELLIQSDIPKSREESIKFLVQKMMHWDKDTQSLGKSKFPQEEQLDPADQVTADLVMTLHSLNDRYKPGFWAQTFSLLNKFDLPIAHGFMRDRIVDLKYSSKGFVAEFFKATVAEGSHEWVLGRLGEHMTELRGFPQGHQMLIAEFAAANIDTLCFRAKMQLLEFCVDTAHMLPAGCVRETGCFKLMQLEASRLAIRDDQMPIHCHAIGNDKTWIAEQIIHLSGQKPDDFWQRFNMWQEQQAQTQLPADKWLPYLEQDQVKSFLEQQTKPLSLSAPLDNFYGKRSLSAVINKLDLTLAPALSKQLGKHMMLEALPPKPFPDALKPKCRKVPY